MANRVLLAGLLVLILVVVAVTRLMPHGTAAEMVTPQQVYFHLHTDDELVASHSLAALGSSCNLIGLLDLCFGQKSRLI